MLYNTEEASFNIRPFLQVADSFSRVNEVTEWLSGNTQLLRHGHCQNIAALYAHVDGSRVGVSALGHVAFFRNGLVYDPIFFPNKTPLSYDEWSLKFPVNEKVLLIKLK